MRARLCQPGRALESGALFGAPGRGFARLNVGTSEELFERAAGRMAAAVSGA
jgi:bifunctional pyridoxal-dependent enzyme with beta-cystathionase and maltose regulon repressor activities